MLPKDEGTGIMVSAMVSRDLGFAYTLFYYLFNFTFVIYFNNILIHKINPYELIKIYY